MIKNIEELRRHLNKEKKRVIDHPDYDNDIPVEELPDQTPALKKYLKTTLLNGKLSAIKQLLQLLPKEDKDV